MALWNNTNACTLANLRSPFGLWLLPSDISCLFFSLYTYPIISNSKVPLKIISGADFSSWVGFTFLERTNFLLSVCIWRLQQCSSCHAPAMSESNRVQVRLVNGTCSCCMLWPVGSWYKSSCDLADWCGRIYIIYLHWDIQYPLLFQLPLWILCTLFSRW